MTRRMWFLFGALIVAAMPLLWLSVDPNAGDRLLRWTQPSTAIDVSARPSHGAIQQVV